MLATLKRLLGHEAIYVALQRGVGADRLRYRCLDALALKPGDRVIDVGCGPAYYFERLPAGIQYHGFDTSDRYIEYAKRRWGGEQVEFRNAIFSEDHVSEIAPVDAIMLLGLLHHLSDEESRELLDLAGRALAPGGRVVSVDT